MSSRWINWMAFLLKFWIYAKMKITLLSKVRTQIIYKAFLWNFWVWHEIIFIKHQNILSYLFPCLFKTPSSKIAYIWTREFTNSVKSYSITPVYAFIVLNFCNIFWEHVGTEDLLYYICQSNLLATIKCTGIARC